MQRYLRGLGIAVLAIGGAARPAFATPVPEIDPSVAQSALTLLVVKCSFSSDVAEAIDSG